MKVILSISLFILSFTFHSTINDCLSRDYKRNNLSSHKFKWHKKGKDKEKSSDKELQQKLEKTLEELKK